MPRLCRNDHEVREGMFVCPLCGSEDVGEREPGRAAVSPDAPPGGPRREQAEQQLTGFVTRGVVLVALGFLGGLVSLWLVAEDSAGGASFFSLLSWVVGAAGAAYLLCGIIGWGVKYGNEATRHDGEPAGG